MNRLIRACALALVLWVARGRAQVIEFEQNGLKYQTLTKSGVTIMFAMMPQHLHDYAIIQVAVSNGSKAPYIIRPEDFNLCPPGPLRVARLPRPGGSHLAGAERLRQRCHQTGHQL